MPRRQVAMKSTSPRDEGKGSGRRISSTQASRTNGAATSATASAKPKAKASRRVKFPKPEGPTSDDSEGGNAPTDEDEDPAYPLPRQDPYVRRELRKKYLHLKEQTSANQNELIRPGSNELMRTLGETDELFKNVQETREAALDSHMVAYISKLAKQKAIALHTNLQVFEPVEFAGKLITLINGENLPEEDCARASISGQAWRKLGEAAHPFFKRSPPLHLMFGSFERGPPKRIEKIPKEPRAKLPDKNDKGPTAPKQLKSFSQLERQEGTTVEVERMLETLQGYYTSWKRPICFFEFVVNPHSFGQTVENMFYASFLVRDGLARIFLDADKLPVIEPVETREGDDVMSRLPKHQDVMSITKEDWRQIIETFQIKEPLVKPRMET